MDVEFALSNAFGFGGTNATLAFRKYSASGHERRRLKTAICVVGSSFPPCDVAGPPSVGNSSAPRI